MMPAVFPVRDRDAVFANSFGDPRSGGERAHRSIDISVLRDGRRHEGALVVAPVRGEVVRAYSEGHGSPRSGNAVSIKDAEGWVHHLAHLRDAPLVTRGQCVEAGTPVGYLGRSGSARSTGPHLHYQIERGGRRANPYVDLVRLRAAMRDGVTSGTQDDDAAREEYRLIEPVLTHAIRRASLWPVQAAADALEPTERERGRTLGEQIRATAPAAEVQLTVARAHARRGEWGQAASLARSALDMVGPPILEWQRHVAVLPGPARALVETVLDLAQWGERASAPLRDGLARRGRAVWDAGLDAAQGGLAGAGVVVVAGVVALAWMAARG